MGNFKLWVNGCDDVGLKPYSLEDINGVRLLKILEEHFIGFNIYYDVSYSVWNEDEWIYSGNDFQAAYRIWENTVNEKNNK